MKKRLRINFVVNDVAGGWDPRDNRLGGTEESVVRWAQELAQRGHEILVFSLLRPYDTAFTHRLVDYYPRNMYSGGGDVCINIKSSGVPRMEPTVYLTNEVNAGSLDLSAYDAVIWPSEWAKRHYPVNNKNVYVVPHGHHYREIAPHRNKVPLQCLYASSPDRGLAALEVIWPNIVEQFPDAHLYVTYGGRLDLPNTTCVEPSEQEMNRLFRYSEFWLYPMAESAIELYCMTGKKAQATGCIPVIIPRMALEDTVATGLFADNDLDYYHTLVQALGMSQAEKDAMREKVVSTANSYNWQQSTDELLAVIQRIV